MNVSPPEARNLCSSRRPFDSKLRLEWHIPDVAPTELGIFCGQTFYSYVAPPALGELECFCVTWRLGVHLVGGWA